MRVTGATARSTLKHDGLHVTRNQTQVEPREAIRINRVLPAASLGLFTGGIDVMECALLERMYYCKVDGQFVAPPEVGRDVVHERLSKIGRRIARATPFSGPVSLYEFVETYTGPKRKLYERAVQSLIDVPVQRSDSVSKCFVKREKCNINKAPRIIQPRDPRYNAALGRFIQPMEKAVYLGIQRALRSRYPVVAKGMNLDQLGRCVAAKWGEFVSPVAVGLDATKFDMHVSKAMLEFEHSVYTSVCRDPELARLLSWQLVNKGRGFAPDGKLKYSVEGKRFSGDMNTSLGNCVIMCSMVQAYCADRGVRASLLNNGDDCVVFMESGDYFRFIRGLEQWFLQLGFRMVAEPPAYELEKVEFCQMKPVFLGSGYRMVRSPRVAIEKDTFCVRTLTGRDSYREWLNGVCIGGLAACDGVPVLSSFYRGLITGGDVRQHMLDDTGMRRMTRGMVCRDSPVTDDARYSFYRAFGIDPDHQLKLEDYFSGISLGFEFDDCVDSTDLGIAN